MLYRHDVHGSGLDHVSGGEMQREKGWQYTVQIPITIETVHPVGWWDLQ